MTAKPQPPAARAIAERALALNAMMIRSGAEILWQDDRDKGQRELANVTGWVSEQDLLKLLSPVEAAQFATPLGSWSRESVGFWRRRAEAFGTLLWACCALPELPPYGTDIDWGDIYAAVGPIDTVEDALSVLKPRAFQELDFALMAAEVWLWRGRVARMERAGLSAEQRRSLVEEPAGRMRWMGLIPDLVDGDFPVGGKAFFRLPAVDASWLYGLAQERKLALAWLLGRDPDWDCLAEQLSQEERRVGLELPAFAMPLRRAENKRPMPDEEEVAGRALSLGALVLRSYFEDEERRRERPNLHDDIVEWVKHPVIARYMTRQEGDLVAAAPGTWQCIVLENVSWRIESLGVLLWALSYADDIPTYDTPFGGVLGRGGVLEPVSAFLDAAILRSRNEIFYAFDVADCWYWRARTAHASRMGAPPPPPHSYAEHIKRVAWSAHRSKEIDRPIKDDFPLFGRAYADLNEDQLFEAQRIAFERFATLNWLCGNATHWEAGPDER